MTYLRSRHDTGARLHLHPLRSQHRLNRLHPLQINRALCNRVRNIRRRTSRRHAIHAYILRPIPPRRLFRHTEQSVLACCVGYTRNSTIEGRRAAYVDDTSASLCSHCWYNGAHQKCWCSDVDAEDAVPVFVAQAVYTAPSVANACDVQQGVYSGAEVGEAGNDGDVGDGAVEEIGFVVVVVWRGEQDGGGGAFVDAEDFCAGVEEEGYCG